MNPFDMQLLLYHQDSKATDKHISFKLHYSSSGCQLNIHNKSLTGSL